MKGPGADDSIRGTKTGRSRIIPIHPDLARWVSDYVDLQGRLTRQPLFKNPRTGARWSEQALRCAWFRACDAAGVRRVGLYEGTKHTFATVALEKGGTERQIQEFLGHADIRSTRRYAKLSDRSLVRLLRDRKIPSF